MLHILEILSLIAALSFAANAAPGSHSGGAAQSSPNPATKKENRVSFNKVTPNLIVADMDKSLNFYRDVLGFTVSQTVPDHAPFIFAWMKRGEADIFLNQQQKPQPGQPDLFAGRQIGGTLSMYITLTGIDDLLKQVEQHGIRPAIPLHKEFYGMKEFAVLDPDGYVIIFAEQAE